MPNPPSPTRRIVRSASLLGAVFAIFAIACLASGWLPWQVRRALATGDPVRPGAASVLAATTGRCHLNADTRAWPAWIVEGLRTHPENQAMPSQAGQPPISVQTNARERG